MTEAKWNKTHSALEKVMELQGQMVLKEKILQLLHNLEVHLELLGHL
jgi:hypothetical protein